MKINNRTIDERVAHSIQRLGYLHVQVADLGNGQIRLNGTVATEDDRAIVVATARSVPGVTLVINEIS